ncbi:unnamed protein product [Trifolium pratense]|uniref:Uncharacterized protein n=1 Tax=Trifolium pratense TaxID=57577 RepID=A0ACB0LMX0_TRIPR|nr:unnamed protein product [Trifolium pratense]
MSDCIVDARDNNKDGEETWIKKILGKWIYAVEEVTRGKTKTNEDEHSLYLPKELLQGAPSLFNVPPSLITSYD